MFSDYLREVLLLRQGPNVSEDAVAIFQLPMRPSVSEVKNWDTFLRFYIVPGDYIFKKGYRQDFLNSVEAQLGLLNYMKPVFESDEFNHRIYKRQELTLRTVKKVLSEASLDINANPFAKNWALTTRLGEWNVYHAWRLFIDRLAQCLKKACAIRAGEHDQTDEAAAQELATLLADVFCVNHHLFLN